MIESKYKCKNCRFFREFLKEFLEKNDTQPGYCIEFEEETAREAELNCFQAYRNIN